MKQSSTFKYVMIKILNLFYPELQLINTKPIMKSKLKDLLDEFKSRRNFGIRL